MAVHLAENLDDLKVVDLDLHLVELSVDGRVVPWVEGWVLERVAPMVA